jgi:hypothetical protein
MDAFVIFGHAYETEGAPRPAVPAGSTLVLTEECGQSGTIPDFYYEALADPGNAVLFADPITHKAAIEGIIRRRIRVYRAGDAIPDITVDPVSLNRAGQLYYLSGLHRLPLREANFTMNASRRGAARFQTETKERSFQGSILAGHARVSLHMLLTEFPGVHYSFLCRTLVSANSSEPNAETEIKATIANEFGVRPDTVFTAEGFNVPRTALDFLDGLDMATLTAEQRAAADGLRERIGAILARRRESGSPLQSDTVESLVRLLAQRAPPAARVAARIAATPAASLNRPERHDGFTPLMMAALRGHTGAIVGLLGRGVAVNTRAHDQTTALGFAASGAHSDVVALLLGAGANPNLASDDGTTPLMLACARPTPAGRACVRALLAAGADVRVADDDGFTALSYAVTWPQEEIVPDLLDVGADATVKTKKGETPMMLSLRERQLGVATLLLTSGAPLDLGHRGPKGSALGYAIAARADGIAMEIIRRVGVTVRPALILKKAKEIGGLPEVVAWASARMASSSERRRRTTRKRSS